MRGAASKVMWVGRATVFMVGLSVTLALVFGVASAALAGNLDPLKIGSLKNVATKTTQLVGKVATGSAFVVKNPSGGSALDLQVNAGQAPMSVNADAGTATNLSADKLDGKDSADFAPTAHTHDDRYYTKTESDGRYLGRTLQVRTTDVTTPANSNGGATASCQTGEQATGGGVELRSGNSKTIFYFQPGGIPAISNGQPTGWRSSWYAETNQATVRVYVVCAS